MEKRFLDEIYIFVSQNLSTILSLSKKLIDELQLFINLPNSILNN